jgi:predicted DNA-binding transcriptional regulator AlpA
MTGERGCGHTSAHAPPVPRVSLASTSGGPGAQPRDDAAQGHTDAVQALTSALEQIAAHHATLAQTHADLARCYDDLRGNAENGLAAFVETSVHALVPAKSLEPEFLTDKQVGELLKVSPRTVRRMAEEERLPAPVRITPGRSRWRLCDLERHFAKGGPK